MCDCLNVLARILIGVLSLVFAILGFGLLIIGIIVKVQSDTIAQLWDPIIQMAKSQAESAVGENIDIPTDNFGPIIEDLVGGLATVFIVLGVVMFVIGVFGVAGACCMVKCMIIGYLIFVAILTIGMLIIVIILAVNKSIIVDLPKPELVKTLENEYQGLNGSDVTSLLWNTIMSWQQCCGISNYKDFEKATKWRNGFGPTTSLGFEIPAACCKAGEFSSSGSQDCTLISSSKNNKDVGCYDKLVGLLVEGTVFIGFACGSVGSLALLTFFAAVILYKKIKKNKVGSYP